MLRVAFVMMMSFVNENAYYVRGSFQRLANGFVAGLQKHGGELVMPRGVEKILLDQCGRAAVSSSTGGRRDSAEYVTSASTPSRPSSAWWPGPPRCRFAADLESRGLSISAFEVFLGVDLDLKKMGVARDLLRPGHSGEEVYDNHACGKVFGCGLSDPHHRRSHPGAPGCIPCASRCSRPGTGPEGRQSSADRPFDRGGGEGHPRPALPDRLPDSGTP
jgi:hypothetical protein